MTFTAAVANRLTNVHHSAGLRKSATLLRSSSLVEDGVARSGSLLSTGTPGGTAAPPPPSSGPRLARKASLKRGRESTQDDGDPAETRDDGLDSAARPSAAQKLAVYECGGGGRGRRCMLQLAIITRVCGFLQFSCRPQVAVQVGVQARCYAEAVTTAGVQNRCG